MTLVRSEAGDPRAEGDGQSGLLECRDGSGKEHFQARDFVPMQRRLHALRDDGARGNDSWLVATDWHRLDPSPVRAPTQRKPS